MSNPARRTRVSLYPLMALLLAVALLLAACADDDPPDSDAADDDTSQDDGDDGDDDADDDGDDDADDADADDELAADVEEFYSNNDVTIVVGSSPGGGFDTYARLIAPYLSEYIPGNPNVVVENMPGAGNLLAMNHIANAAPADGSVIGNASGGVAIRQLLGDSGVQFDLRDLGYIGQPDRLGTRVLIANSNQFDGEFDDLFDFDRDPLVIATQGPGSLQHDPATSLEHVLDLNVLIVDGYPGTGDMDLAMQQGEADAFFTSYHSARASNGEKFDSGEWRVVAKFAEADEGDLNDDLLDIPSVYDYAETQRDRDILYYAAGMPRSYIRIYTTPPGTPEHRHAALEEAFHAVLEDPDFLAEAEALDVDITPIPGAQIAEAMDEFLSLPDDLVEELSAVLGIELD